MYPSVFEDPLSVDCHSAPEHILVSVETDVPFEGLVYASDRYGDPECTAFGRGNGTTLLRVPLRGCGTRQKVFSVKPDSNLQTLGYKQSIVLTRPMILVIDYGKNDMQSKGDPMTSPSPGPEVQLRIYDFENDVFVDTVHLGQMVELEVAIRDGRIYQGSISDCDAINYNGTRFPVVRNFNFPIHETVSSVEQAPFSPLSLLLSSFLPKNYNHVSREHRAHFPQLLQIYYKVQEEKPAEFGPPRNKELILTSAQHYLQNHQADHKDYWDN
ncbi:hypothetical protein JTE90_010203 [Oedothorax gibbosus]|uniref:ZP domain-containing protein n=1 Tax=Oedothorax gibbosus TaxID=931172 RepID=A0AAV6UIZ1_9ARAC|nr:hypothetical protein JTE90_010203 [Oedothorax gibbosus]